MTCVMVDFALLRCSLLLPPSSPPPTRLSLVHLAFGASGLYYILKNISIVLSLYRLFLLDSEIRDD